MAVFHPEAHRRGSLVGVFGRKLGGLQEPLDQQQVGGVLLPLERSEVPHQERVAGGGPAAVPHAARVPGAYEVLQGIAHRALRGPVPPGSGER